MRITLRNILTELDLKIGDKARVVRVFPSINFSPEFYLQPDDLLWCMTSAYNGRPHIINVTRQFVLFELSPHGYSLPLCSVRLI